METLRDSVATPCAGKAVTVLLVEDSTIVRDRIAALIGERVPCAVIVGQAADGHRARELIEEHSPNAVVLDLELPGVGGLELLPEFKRHHPDCVVIVLTNHSSAGFRERCLALGADHFFDKYTEFERVPEILACVRA